MFQKSAFFDTCQYFYHFLSFFVFEFMIYVFEKMHCFAVFPFFSLFLKSGIKIN